MKPGRSAAPLACASLFVTASLMGGCSDDPAAPSEPQGDAVGVILTSIDRALTVFSVDAPAERYEIGLAPDGSPVNLAVRGSLAAVPLGTVPAVAVADLGARTVVRTVPLPEGSGATGIAFLNDSIAVAGNPGRNTVSLVNVLRGTHVGEIDVGTYPHAAASVRDTVFIVNANLGPDFMPAGPSTVSVIADQPARVVRTITLSGSNAGAAVATDNGQLIVLNAGSFGEGDGSISVISRATLTETRHVPGFGEFPGSVGVGPDGRIHVASFSYGVAVWDPTSETFTHAPTAAVEPGGIPSAAALGFDEEGRLYTLSPECAAPGRALRLTATFMVETEIPTGLCPFAIAFTRLE